MHGRLMTTIFVVTMGVVWLDPLHTLRLSICLLVTARIQDAQRHTVSDAINNTARPLSSVERKVLGGQQESLDDRHGDSALQAYELQRCSCNLVFNNKMMLQKL